FNVNFWVIIPIALMFICAWMRVPAVPTLFINIGVSVMFVFIGNPQITVTKIASIIENGFISKTGNIDVDQLLTRGGIASMMGTVALIVVTLSLGGILVHLGLIEQIMAPIAQRLNSNGKLILAVIASAIGVNLFIGEQFLSVILPGKAFKPTFERSGLANVTLSRALEDGGT
ncbi:Na+/H+ antiporter NhaC, partial [Enterococcus faecium]|nr:Na+/H+ antiporter NhaC [Enterococcus faecium]